MTASTLATLEHEIGVAGLLVIETREGTVRLRAAAGGTVRAHADELEDAADIDRATGSLSIRAARHGTSEGDRRRPPLDDLSVEVPTRATVVVETTSGTIAVEGLLGDQRYRSASGDVTLREVAGRLTVDAVSGDVEATIVDDVELTARTVSGDLALRAATIGALTASTASGDLKIAGRLAGPGPFAIETVSGDLLLALAGDVRIELQTVTGDIRSEVESTSDGGRGRRVVTVGATGPTLRVRSMSGDVRLVRPSAVTRTVSVDSDGQTAARSASSTFVPVASAESMETTGTIADTDAARLAILRSLERGDIDVAEATRRLEVVDGIDDRATTGDTTTTIDEEATDA
jgi:hypothetical protein